MWKKRGQSITDRLLAARYTLTGQDVAKSVCKATTDQPIAPKKKHLDYLIYCTNKPDVKIAELANVLAERARSSRWIVVFKALITTHYILIHGSERFLHYLASSNNTFELDHFLDRNDSYGFAMSPYIRRYARYLNTKVSAYKTVVCDFCRMQCGKDVSAFVTMSDEALLETLTLVQDVLDALLQFGCTAADLSNGIIVMAVNLLFRDLIRLFAFYNEGVINLLRRYFDMKKKQCEEALAAYKNFLTRLEGIPGFIKVCETTGLSAGSACDLKHVPDSLLDALQQHLSSLEGHGTSGLRGQPQSARAFHLWLQNRTAPNQVLIPKQTCDWPRSTSLPSSGNEMCKVTFRDHKCDIESDTSGKLDLICDDPIKLIRNPFVSPELLATKPALSRADVWTYYSPETRSTYIPSPFVSDEDFATAFQQAENCNVSRVTSGVPHIQPENFWNIDRLDNVSSPHASYQRSTPGWCPQQLHSINAPGYVPMCGAMSSNLTARGR